MNKHCTQIISAKRKKKKAHSFTSIEPENKRLCGRVSLCLHEVVEERPLALVIHANVARVLPEAHLRLPGELRDPLRSGSVARTQLVAAGSSDEHQGQGQWPGEAHWRRHRLQGKGSERVHRWRERVARTGRGA
jgi:hypothetical protein